jgi:DNA-binding CsgD family transcriptional regulator
MAWAFEERSLEDLLMRELTDLQKGIVAFFAWGMPLKAIAFESGRSTHTLSEHMNRIKKKISARNQQEVVRYAVAAGLIPNTYHRGELGRALPTDAEDLADRGITKLLFTEPLRATVSA